MKHKHKHKHTRPFYYHLPPDSPREPRSTCQLIEGRWVADDDLGEFTAKVAETRIGPILISTMFTGCDTALEGPPMIFQTIVADLAHERVIFVVRFSTWAKALEGHAEAVHSTKSAMIAFRSVLEKEKKPCSIHNQNSSS